ncbi:alpha/beta hydrolase [Methylobacterium sp. J-076]|uniref:alpha/beta hydrolase n=1 Tax=Methylobacterium sp. J-076 TaxID=2836655 RepID=UPI001FB99C22|nr:alpha/beta hydrolase [Methylobacterium sp. J-076]MCJ2013313.1 alpha/beta hydrolase [Methylobacterium sp. J-076]
MPDRRSLLLTLAAAMAVSPARAIGAPERIPLWPGIPPGGGGPMGPLRRDDSGAVSNIATPVLEAFLPERPTGIAVLVAGGGGYARIGLVKEAYPAAYWLAAQGITAFVLTYRLPQEGWNDGPAVALQDVQRGLRLIRAQAERFGIDPARIGVMGFSAGGHLCGMAASRSAFRSYAPVDAADEGSARPDFASLIYPVVSLEPPYDRTTSRRSLVGEAPSPADSAAWSLQTYVRGGCPPIFLVQTDDDPVIGPEHSRILDTACRAAQVPVEYHRFAVGGHGFGIGRSDTSVALWPRLYRLWLSSIALTR